MSQASCPRCAYDLSGHAASWSASCPVSGRCSECGLAFAWREVLVERERWNRRHIEHCPRGRIPGALARTSLWCAMPWVFWGRVRLHHEPRVRRMVLWLALFLVAVHVPASLATALGIGLIERRDAASFNRTRAWDVQILTQFRAFLLAQDPSEVPNFAAQRADLDGAIALASKPLPEAAMKPNDLARAFFAPVLFVRNDSDPVSQYRVDRTPFMPRLKSGWQVSPPRFWRHRAFLAGLTLSIAYPMLLLALPATRRRLRIRGGHLWRATIFGMAWLAVPSLVRLGEAVILVYFELTTPMSRAGTPPSRLGDSWAHDWALWSWMILLWVSAWWLSALWRGLCFPRPVFHWALITLAAMLLAVIALLMFSNVDGLDGFVDAGTWLTPSSRSSLQRLAEHGVDFVR